MDKRLAEIKEWMKFRSGSHADNVRWLIERNEFLEKAHETNTKVAEHLKQERDSYKQALEKTHHILNVTPYREYTTNKIRQQLFDISHKALEDSQ